MSSVEGNENIEEAFNKILREEYKQEWKLITIPRKLLAFLCYTIPAMLMLSAGDYHTQNVLVILFFSSIIGAGFYSYLRQHVTLKAFFSNDRPLRQVIDKVKAQNGNELHEEKLTVEEESDWSLIISKLERSMNTTEDEDSDTMNLSTLFDRGEQTTFPPKKTSWLSRLFGRK